MNRRNFLRFLGASACCGLSGCSNTIKLTSSKQTRPNFVFLLIDDMGWMDTGCYGSKFYDTPNIDRLAKEGMQFTNAYAACPVCSPTRASILTGKYPTRMQLTTWIGAADQPTEYRHYMPLEEVTIAETLKEAGYATGFIGKWHLCENQTHYPKQQGFDINVGGDWRGSPPSYFVPYKISTMQEGPDGEYLTDRLTEDAVKFIEDNKNRPFLLYLSHYAVHTPLQAKKELIDKYKTKTENLPKHTGPQYISVDEAFKTKQIQDNPTYAAMIASVDESVGCVMKKLKTLGLENNTIIIFTSDNGGLSTVPRPASTANLPLRAGKGWLYEGGIREPAIIKWPGMVRPDSVCNEPIVSMDFYPTILEMANLSLKPRQHKDGISLVPLLKGTGKISRRAIYWHFPHYHGSGSRPSGAIRAGDYKLIEWFEDSRIELYNLKDDLGEKDNLAAKMPEKAAELRNLLYKWRKETGAKMPVSGVPENFESWRNTKWEPTNSNK